MNCDPIVLIILVGFVLAITWVVTYFFVYKQNQADLRYNNSMEKINRIGKGWF